MPERDPLQTLWTQHTEEPFTMSLAEIHMRATKFQGRIRTRNFTEYAAAALVIAIFGWMAVTIPVPLAQAGCGLIIAGALYVCWKLHTLARAGSREELDAAASLADYHRAELIRQRGALATVWRWYLAPFLPGVVLFNAGVTFAGETGLSFVAQLGFFAVSMGFVGAIFAAIAWLNAAAVKKLDREIAAWDRTRQGQADQ